MVGVVRMRVNRTICISSNVSLELEKHPEINVSSICEEALKKVVQGASIGVELTKDAKKTKDFAILKRLRESYKNNPRFGSRYAQAIEAYSLKYDIPREKVIELARGVEK